MCVCARCVVGGWVEAALVCIHTLSMSVFVCMCVCVWVGGSSLGVWCVC